MSLPSPATIRPLRADDAPALTALFAALEADPEARRFFHPHPLTREMADSLCARSPSARDRYDVAECGGLLVGYAMLRGWDEGYTVPSFGAAVHPEFRGQGLGRALLRYEVAAARAAGAVRLRLTVYRANRAACRLYAHEGFRLEPRGDDQWLGLLDLRSAAGRRAA
jgi:ribosomal protein S18 acetylase RimI-like enzyme